MEKEVEIYSILDLLIDELGSDLQSIRRVHHKNSSWSFAHPISIDISRKE